MLNFLLLFGYDDIDLGLKLNDVGVYVWFFLIGVFKILVYCFS